MNCMTVNQLIFNFHGFILACWPQLSVIMENLDWDNEPYFVEDWIQANWELMVERQLLSNDHFLLPYGYGVGTEHRHTNIGKLATHRVIATLKRKNEKYRFLCFTSKNSGAIKFEVPFELVSIKNLSTGAISHAELDKVEFSVESFS